MTILLSLSPFVVFFAVMRLASPVAGLVGGFAASLALSATMRWRGHPVKILEAGSLILFALLAAYTWVTAAAWTVATVRLAVDGGLLAIVLVSLAIDRPFTLQYARERVPQALWASPVFLRTNRIITAVWGLAFAVLVAADATAEYLPAVPLWIEVAASVGAFLGAVWFTRVYPDAVRRRFEASAP
jgi:hypothetical protein